MIWTLTLCFPLSRRDPGYGDAASVLEGDLPTDPEATTEGEHPRAGALQSGQHERERVRQILRLKHAIFSPSTTYYMFWTRRGYFHVRQILRLKDVIFSTYLVPHIICSGPGGGDFHVWLF